MTRMLAPLAALAALAATPTLAHETAAPHLHMDAVNTLLALALATSLVVLSRQMRLRRARQRG